MQYFAEMRKKYFVETSNVFWFNKTVPVGKSVRLLRRRPNGTEFITGPALQPSDKLFGSLVKIVFTVTQPKNKLETVQWKKPRK